MSKLTIKKAKSLSKAGMYNDSPTLYLNVTPRQTKSWVQRLTIEGRRHDLGLGGFPLVSPTHARRSATENRLAVLDGRNPLAEKRKAQAPKFEDIAAKTYEVLRPRWRSEKVAKNWKQILRRHALPRLGHLRVDKIGREDVLKVLTPIWTEKPETARRVRRYIKQTLAFAQANGLIEHNVAGEMIEAALPKMPAVRKNMRSLPFKEVPAAVWEIRCSSASMPARAALEFLILTAARTGEVLNAKWSDIDLEEKLWTIPPDRMKTGKAHRQPLSDEAISVLEEMELFRDESDLVFQSTFKKGCPLSSMVMPGILKRIGLADRAHVHGFRASFRTWASERTNADHAVMELCLAHAVGNAVEQAYARAELLAKRRSLLARWGKFATDKDTKAKVVKLHG